MWSVFINRSSTNSPFTFQDLSNLQERVLESGQTALLFAEVDPTITLGNRQDPSAFAHLQKQGLAVVAGNRGGLETWHGPGQWVGFVVCPIERLSGKAGGVRRAVHAILESLMPVVRGNIPEARMEEGARLGIWSDRGKVVSIGIRVRRGWVTSGFALNVIPQDNSFRGINPCGILEAVPDFLFKNRVNQADWSKGFDLLPSQIAAEFQKR